MFIMFLSSIPQTTLILIHLAIIALLIAFVIYNHIRLKRIILRYEQQVLISQMNPHFVFNSLTAIQSYIFRNEPHKASKYLANFAKLTRLVLENSRAELCSIDREITTLKLYLDLQKLRFVNKFSYTIVVDESIDIKNVLIPPMLAQPLIENAIEHGLSSIESEGVLSIRYILSKPNELTIEVEDNGIGINKARLLQLKNGKSYKSLATEITKERIEKLRRLGKSGIKMSITDKSTISKTQTGTIARIIIPI